MYKQQSLIALLRIVLGESHSMFQSYDASFTGIPNMI